MNKDLESRLIAIKRDCYKTSKELEAAFESATTKEEKEDIRAKHEAVVNKYNETYNELESYRTLVNKADKTEEEKKSLEDMETALCAKYSVAKKAEAPKKLTSIDPAKDPEAAEVVGVHPATEKQKDTAKKKGGRILALILAGAALLSGGYLLGKHTNIKLFNSDKEIVREADDEQEKEESTKVEKPFEVFGNFTDVTNEKQLEERVTWYFNTYEAPYFENATEAEKEARIFELMNTVRFINGEFKLDENGEVTYNATDVAAMGNEIDHLVNEASYKDKRVSFRDYAPLFTDGSKAQKVMIEFDAQQRAVTEAIAKNNTEAFTCAAIKWGEMFNQAFVNSDQTLATADLSVYTAEVPSHYPLFSIMYDFYADNILEYSLANDINICVPTCFDNNGELQYTPLAQMMEDYNDKPIDYVAKRAGDEEYHFANNDPWPTLFGQEDVQYFNSKYELEVGKSRSLR